jgi:hypothetical protein
MAWIVVLLAASIGLAHVVQLGRAARLGPRPVEALARLLVVGTLLALAAASGWLAAGALGWGAGFAGGAVVLAWRWR